MANNSEKQYFHIEPMGAKVYRPIIQISFHTETQCYHAFGAEKNKYGEDLIPDNQVLAVVTNKTLESPAGSFTITLAGSQWATYLSPNNITVIQMGYMGEKKTTVMVGLIDSINRKRSISSDGTPSVNTHVTGRDFGKLLVRDVLKFYPELMGGHKDLFLTEDRMTEMLKIFNTDRLIKGTPPVIIDNIMRFIFMRFHDTQWVVYDEYSGGSKKHTVQAGQIVRYQLGEVNFFMPFIFTADQFEGSLWNLMERASVKPFTELWIDVRSSEEAWNPSPKNRAVPHTVAESSSPDKANLKEGAYPSPSFQFGEDGAKVLLCLRETPYDSKMKDNLVTHFIDPVDVINEDLTRSDSEHYNLFWAGTTINPIGLDLKRVAPPLLNETNAKKWGIIPLEVNIEGLSISEDPAKFETEKKAMEGMSKTYSAKLKACYENNHNYWNGTLEMRGNATIRIGHRAIYQLPSMPVMEYYIEGVSQSFNVFEGWTTNLSVTRGMKTTAKVESTTYIPKEPVKTPPNPAPKPTPPKDQYHVVVKGDTLWDLAKKYYKNNNDWRLIWEANKAMLIARDKRNATQHGHWIHVGTTLRIPPKQ